MRSCNTIETFVDCVVCCRLPPYSRDAADIGSGFTQRVLALKALAGLLG